MATYKITYQNVIEQTIYDYPKIFKDELKLDQLPGIICAFIVQGQYSDSLNEVIKVQDSLGNEIALDDVFCNFIIGKSESLEDLTSSGGNDEPDIRDKFRVTSMTMDDIYNEFNSFITNRKIFAAILVSNHRQFVLAVKFNDTTFIHGYAAACRWLNVDYKNTIFSCVDSNMTYTIQ